MHTHSPESPDLPRPLPTVWGTTSPFPTAQHEPLPLYDTCRPSACISKPLTHALHQPRPQTLTQAVFMPHIDSQKQKPESSGTSHLIQDLHSVNTAIILLHHVPLLDHMDLACPPCPCCLLQYVDGLLLCSPSVSDSQPDTTSHPSFLSSRVFSPGHLAKILSQHRPINSLLRTPWPSMLLISVLSPVPHSWILRCSPLIYSLYQAASGLLLTSFLPSTNNSSNLSCCPFCPGPVPPRSTQTFLSPYLPNTDTS